MAVGALTPITRWQVMKDGQPAAGAKLYTYLSGTNTPSPVYNNADLDPSHAHTNPVVADADGVLPVIYLAALAYRFLITDANGVTIFPAQDGVYDFAQVQLAASGGSALVGFIQAGAGAVARTAQAKMRETFSVTDFGAVGDGTTDDTAAIQACLDAVPDATIDGGGGAVFFPRGTYIVTDTLEPKPHTHLYGEGIGISTLEIPDNCVNTSFTMLYMNGGPPVLGELPMRYVTLSDLSLNGNDNNNGSGTQSGIKYRRSQYCAIERVEVRAFKSNAITYSWATGEDINSSCTLSHSLIRDCNDDHIVIQNSTNIDIIDNIIRTGSGNAIVFSSDPSGRIKICNNEFNQPAKSGVLCIASNATISVQIQGNLFYSCNSTQTDRGAVHATSVTAWDISGNSFYNLLGSGIIIDSNNGVVTNNYVYKCGRYGIYASSATRMSIRGNTVIDASQGTTNTYDGIYATVSASQITGNMVTDTNGAARPRYGLNLDGSASNSIVEANTFNASGVTANFNPGATSTVTIGNVGNGETCGFVVKLAANQTNIATGSDVTVLFDTETVDVGANFNPATWTFTAPIRGLYHFDIGLILLDIDSAANFYRLRLNINNADNTLSANYTNIFSPLTLSGDTTHWTLPLSVTVPMTVGQKALVVLQQSGGSAQTDIDSDSQFQGYFVKSY